MATLYNCTTVFISLIINTGIDKIYSLLSVPIFLFARIIRIAQLEVENLKDKGLLNTIFSANMAFVSTILATLAIIIKICR